MNEMPPMKQLKMCAFNQYLLEHIQKNVTTTIMTNPLSNLYVIMCHLHNYTFRSEMKFEWVRLFSISIV